MMNRILKLTIGCVLVLVANMGRCQQAVPMANNKYVISSPNKKIKAEIQLGNKIYYSVKLNDTILLMPSAISMTLEGNKILGQNPVLIKYAVQKVKNEIRPVWGKRKTIVNEYEELVLDLGGNYKVVFRVYNDGVAYRFETNLPKQIKIIDEEVNYHFKDYPNGWFPAYESYETTYEYKKLFDLDKKKLYYLPLIVEANKKNSNVKLLITEADVIDYPSLLIKKSDDWENNLYGSFRKFPLSFQQGGFSNFVPTAKAEANYIAFTSGKRSFPWRVMLITENDKQLLDNDIVFKLAKDQQIAKTDWIKPGLVSWEWWHSMNLEGVNFITGQNNKTYQYYIDFAAKNNIPYILIDWKWSDVHDLTVPNPDVDLPALVAEAKSKNVKVIVWCLAYTIYDNLEKNLDYLKKMGVSGVKIDFFDREDQLGNQMYERIAIETAKREMIVDFHGCAKPSGLHKAYPNIVNYEAVKGNENNLWGEGISPEHQLTIPFIRMAVGPMDFTPGGFRNVAKGQFHGSGSLPMVNGTRMHQLAMFVAYEAGLQMLCDAPTSYTKHPELLKLMTTIPVSWDETIALDGKIGEYLVIARKSGNDWYVVGMTNWTERTLPVDLSFLPNGIYDAQLFTDGINANRLATEYKITEKEVNRQTRLELKLAEGGGFVLKLSLKP